MNLSWEEVGFREEEHTQELEGEEADWEFKLIFKPEPLRCSIPCGLLCVFLTGSNKETQVCQMCMHHIYSERVIFHGHHKMLGLTEAHSTHSAVVGQAVHVVYYVHF